MEAVREAAPAPHDPFLDLVPDAGREAHAAPLRLSQDLGGLRQSLLLLHHSQTARRRSSRVRPATCCAKPKSWSRPGSRSCSSFRRTPAPMASTCATPRERPRPDGAAGARALPRSDARTRRRSAPGCGCTTSIPIRMSTRSIALMSGGNVLPYLDIPFQHASPTCAQGDAAGPAIRKRRWSASAPGARSAPI